MKQDQGEKDNPCRKGEAVASERRKNPAGVQTPPEAKQDYLVVLNTIANCVIKDTAVSVTISQTLEQLTQIFSGCGAAYLKISPGDSLLNFELACGPDFLPDLKGYPVDVAKVRPVFKDLFDAFKPCTFSRDKNSAHGKAFEAFVKKTGIQSGMVVPLHQDNRLTGAIFIYSPLPRPWPQEEISLMEQVGDALVTGIRHRQNKEKMLAQEQFLGNVFDGMGIGIFVLTIKENVLVIFEKVNQEYEFMRRLSRGRVQGSSLDSLAESMDPSALNVFKENLGICIQEKKPVKFLEETRDKEKKKYWLTRLSPVCDNQGNVFRIIGASTDISEQKQIETALIKNEARLKEAQRIAKLGDCERDIHTRGLSCSDQLYQIFGWDSNLCPGHADFIEILHPGDREYVETAIENAVKEKSAYDIEYRIFQGGLEKIINEIGEVVVDESGNARKIAGIVQDVTEQKKFKDELELARKVFDNAVEGVVVTNAEGIIEFVNKGFTTITGYTEQEAVGENTRMLKSDRHDRHFYAEMWTALDRDGHWSGEIWNRRKNGEAYPEWLSITTIVNRQGDPLRYMAVFNDLSDIREREEQLRFQANYDALTGLPNRTLLQDRIDMSIRRVERENHGLTVIFLDMDDFKHVNDTLGHAKGDLLLQQFASRILSCVREQDTVARYGGDEFIVLIPDTNNPDIIIQIIERIRTSVEKSFVIDAKEFFLGVSIGVTMCPEDGADPDTLISNADMAMYRSKEEGKGSYAFFTAELNQQVATRVEMEVDLRHALARQEFLLYYQAKLDIKTNRICGAEALLRWNHPVKGLVPPNEFIPLAEETGLINPMGEWILDQASIRAKEWSKILNRHFGIAVNISFRQVRDMDLVVQVSQCLERHQIHPDCLELEITESAVMGNVEKAKTMFGSLHDMGVKISIDDFGTGFSSLSYLRLFPVSTLKIDKSFVDDIPLDNDSNTMVTTIISMARHLNLTTVAEGVEDLSQLEFLKANNCNQIQGYYFAKPMPADQFLAFIKKHE